MSSPIAKAKRGLLRAAAVSIHQRLSHNHRVEILSHKVASLIRTLYPDREEIRCLDVGCGDMQVSERVLGEVPRTVWTCIDVHDLPETLKTDSRWATYRKFDGLHIPFEDRSFDMALFCDVLHHAGDNAENLLREAARVSTFVIIKDHFEYSLYSRIMLKAMDFIGNWGYGIVIPKTYLRPRSFADLSRSAGLTIERLDTGIDLYAHLPVVRAVLRSEWHFIAVLRPAAAEASAAQVHQK